MSYLYFKPGTTRKQMVEKSKEWMLTKELAQHKQVCDMCKHDQFIVYDDGGDTRIYCASCGFSQLTEYMEKGWLKRASKHLKSIQL